VLYAFINSGSMTSWPFSEAGDLPLFAPTDPQGLNSGECHFRTAPTFFKWGAHT
jgi:ABC-type branched-subunit amino acid transport system substrate-binding protein